MTRFRRVGLLALGLLLTGALSSCGPLEEWPSAQPANTGIPTAGVPATKGAVVPQATAAAQAAATLPSKVTAPAQPVGEQEYVYSAQEKALEKFQSYRLTQKTSWAEEKGEKGSWESATELVRQPKARRTILTLTSDGKVADRFEEILIDDVAYINVSGEWLIQQSADASRFMEGMTGWGGPETYIGGQKGVLVGREQVNGLDTRHYRYDAKAFNAVSFGSYTEARADVWVSTQHNVVVKVVLHIVGSDKDKGRVTLDMESSLSDINKSIAIKPPEGMRKPELPADVVVLPGAKGLTLTADPKSPDNLLVSYRVAGAQASVAKLYQEQMRAKGWKVEDSEVATLLMFHKDGREVTVMLAEADKEVVVTLLTGQG